MYLYARNIDFLHHYAIFLLDLGTDVPTVWYIFFILYISNVYIAVKTFSMCFQ
jgi:hypothetical protein